MAEGLGSYYFGLAAAENEVAEDAERFLATYLDKWSLLSAVEQHKRFLVLGPKGTGKSAAAHYVRLAWKKRHGEGAVFDTLCDFDELNRTLSPLASLDKKLVGDVPALTDAAWRLFIGIRLLDSLLSDPMCSLTRDPQVVKFAADLKQAGLASHDFPQVLRKVRERKGTVAVPSILGLEGSSIQTDSVPVNQVGEALLRLVTRASTPNRHLLAIDGLDKAIGDNPAYWQTLAALVRVADGVTRALRAAQASHAFVLIMCRSDVFRRVRFADGAKIAADGAIQMDWGAEAENPRDVQLWEYIADKAGTGVDELFRFLPETVHVGGSQRIATDRYLLQFTRYTPRDMTLLFSSLQQVCSVGKLTNSQARRGVDHFASRHLLTEIMSEATGLLPDSMIDRFETILGSMPQRVFDREALEAAMVDAGFDSRADVDRFGEYLFLQGAIGNYRPDVGYVQFYHRRDAYKWQKTGPWVMHNGLVYAFNIPWSARPAGKNEVKTRSGSRRVSSASFAEGTLSRDQSRVAAKGVAAERREPRERRRRRKYRSDGERGAD
ncbi:P-loop ATPase, Sll1717 family [Cellulosimicrobium cellulans]|uniref:P-loop ATPase, Sll1717 family n=1 Tax=Cellulosimicrobium cellulans TaxID=1710 RepID=UPI001112E39F|nr:hypothetical protein [Cellulosimicrobium cellulans]